MNVGFLILSNGIGGAEKRFAHLYNHLAAAGSEDRFSLVLPNRLFRHLLAQGLLREGDPNVHRLFRRPPESLYNAYPLALFGWRMRGPNLPIKLLARWALRRRDVQETLRRFDLIHCVIPNEVLLGVLPRDRPVVQELMDYQLADYATPLMREHLRGDTVFSCLSDGIRDAFLRRTGPGLADRVAASPCSFTDYSRTTRGVKERLVVFLGRMQPTKNPWLFVEAIRLLAADRRDFRALMLGTGPLDRAMDARIRSCGLRHVLTRRYDAHPETTLAKALVFATLQRENYPSQALLEAMACGCAVVATDTGQTRRLVDDTVGRVVPPQPEPVADALAHLLDHPDQAEAMGRCARERVLTCHTVTAYAAYLLDRYRRLLAARAAAAPQP
jgi:glycosyltransferase involved in cell wall biosynthesis